MCQLPLYPNKMDTASLTPIWGGRISQPQDTLTLRVWHRRQGLLLRQASIKWQWCLTFKRSEHLSQDKILITMTILYLIGGISRLFQRVWPGRKRRQVGSRPQWIEQISALYLMGTAQAFTPMDSKHTEVGATLVTKIAPSTTNSAQNRTAGIPKPP